MPTRFLHVMTPCSRPENLRRLAESIVRAWPATTDEMQWWVVIDGQRVPDAQAMAIQKLATETPPYFEGWWTKRAGIAGHQARNQVLDRLLKSRDGGRGGYICFLDDDTVVEPAFFRRTLQLLREHPGQALMCDQLVQRGDTIRLHAAAGNMRVSSCDTGQGVIPLEMVGEVRFDDHYDADGRWYAELYRRAPERFVFVNEPLTRYNALR